MPQSHALINNDSGEYAQKSAAESSEFAKTNQKFQSSTLSKGFFANQQDNDLYSPQSYSPTKILDKPPKDQLNESVEVQSPQRSRRTRTKDSIRLKPLDKSSKVQVFKNVADNEKYQGRRRMKRANNKQDIEKLSQFNNEQQHISDDDNDDDDQENEKNPSAQTKQMEEQLAISTFEQDETKRKLKETEEQQIQQISMGHLPRQNKRDGSANSQNQEEQDQISNQSPRGKSSEDSPDKFVKATSGSQNLKKVLLSPVRQDSCMKMSIHRTTSGFFDLWPQYGVYFQHESSFLMNGKKVSRTPYSTFVVSNKQDDFEQNGPNYLIKAKSSVMGDQLDIFGPGLNPNNAYDKKVKPRQFLATVIYQTRYLQSGQPRNFKVYLKKPQADYYKAFPQIKMYQQQISLNLLYQNQDNRKDIIVLRNRAPLFSERVKGYMLNFKGRVTVPSVKNFILEDESNPKEEVMIFGKYSADKFHMDVQAPLTPSIGFGIVLSTFDSKFFCE